MALITTFGNWCKPNTASSTRSIAKPERTQEAERFKLRARNAANKQQFKKAMHWNIRALETVDASSWEAAECYNALVQECLHMKNADEALVYGEKLKEFVEKRCLLSRPHARKGKENDDPSRVDPSIFTQTLWKLGQLLVERGERDRALEYFTDSIRILQVVKPNSRTLAVAHLELGEILHAQGKDDRAHEEFVNARKIQKLVMPQSPSRIRTYLGLASTSPESNVKIGFLDKALNIAKTVHPAPRPLIAQVHIQCGHEFLRINDTARAVQSFEKALALLKSTPSPDTHAAALLEIAHACEVHGQVCMAGSYRRRSQD